jgi:hypothetical protein
MRIAGGVALLVLAGLLSGCLDYTEEIWLNANGSARLDGALSIKQVMGMDPLPDHNEDFDDELSSGRSWTEHKDGYSTQNFNERIKGDFRKTGTLAPGHVKLGKLNPDWYTIEPLGLGRYRVQRSITLPTSGIPSLGDISGNPLAKLAEGFGRSMAEEAMAGHQVQITLHAPLILSSNADEKHGMGTAVWRREITSMARGDSTPLHIEAEVLLIDWRYVAAGGALLLLILVLLIRSKLKRGPKAKTATA